jgi:CcmD family protein
MNDMATLATAYLAFAALIGGYTWHMISRLSDLHRRLDATEEAVVNLDNESAGHSDE